MIMLPNRLGEHSQHNIIYIKNELLTEVKQKCHRDKCTLPMMLGYQPRQSLEEEFDQTQTVHCSTQRESARPHRPRDKWTCCETGRKRTPCIRLK